MQIYGTTPSVLQKQHSHSMRVSASEDVNFSLLLSKSSLTKLRKDELEKITLNLDKIRRMAIPITTKDFGKFIRV